MNTLARIILRRVAGNPGRRRKALGAAGILLLFAFQASAAELVLRESWGNVFGGEKLTLHAALNSETPFAGRMTATLRSGSRTLVRTERAEAPWTFELAVPPVDQGIVFPLTLELTAIAAGTEVARLERTLWVFPEDPFAQRAQWLKGLNIHLYDPGGATREVLDTAEVPYTRIANPAAFADIKDGLLIIGEGVSFDERPGLAPALFEAAAAGVPVLCLAPADGALPLPGSDSSDLPAPGSFRFASSRAIAELDKRLDATVWLPGQPGATRRLLVEADRASVRVRVSQDPGAWSWMELSYAPDGARFIMTTLSIVERWDDAPTPRFLFVRMLEWLTETTETEL